MASLIISISSSGASAQRRHNQSGESHPAGKQTASPIPNMTTSLFAQPFPLPKEPPGGLLDLLLGRRNIGHRKEPLHILRALAGKLDAGRGGLSPSDDTPEFPSRPAVEGRRKVAFLPHLDLEGVAHEGIYRPSDIDLDVRPFHKFPGQRGVFGEPSQPLRGDGHPVGHSAMEGAHEPLP